MSAYTVNRNRQTGRRREYNRRQVRQRAPSFLMEASSFRSHEAVKGAHSARRRRQAPPLESPLASEKDASMRKDGALRRNAGDHRRRGAAPPTFPARSAHPDLDNFFLNVRTSAILSFRRSGRFAFGRGNDWGKGRKIHRSGVCQFLMRQAIDIAEGVVKDSLDKP